MKTILVTLPVERRHREKLENAAPGCIFRYCGDGKPTAEQVQSANIIVGTPPAALIGASKKLELLQLSSAGTDPYIVPGVLAEGTILCNATGAYSKAVSEHALAQTLMLQKKLHLYRDVQREGRWSDFGTVTSMTDATVLVVGLGDIGLRYARMCKALGAYTIGVKRRESPCPEGVDELCLTGELDRVLPRADVIASFLPGTGGTYHLYTRERFENMKDSAIFINCGRGGAVEAEVLYRALQEGQIAAAAVDVTEPEPLPADSPLWQQENLLITPHVSGFFHLPETFERIIDIAADNLRAYLSGDALKNIVDFETGYKK